MQSAGHLKPVAGGFTPVGSLKSSLQLCQNVSLWFILGCADPASEGRADSAAGATMDVGWFLQEFLTSARGHYRS